MKTIKVIDLLNKIANGEEVPKKIKAFSEEFDYDGYDYYSIHSSSPLMSYVGEDYLRAEMNYDIEIIEEKKKFTKEDFINERMGIDKITRKEFDEMYEVKECNCGMPYCKGFIAVDKEEPQEHKIPEKLKIEQDTPNSNFYIRNEYGTKCALTKHSKIIADKINEILDYLGEIE